MPFYQAPHTQRKMQLMLTWKDEPNKHGELPIAVLTESFVWLPVEFTRLQILWRIFYILHRKIWLFVTVNFAWNLCLQEVSKSSKCKSPYDPYFKVSYIAAVWWYIIIILFIARDEGASLISCATVNSWLATRACATCMHSARRRSMPNILCHSKFLDSHSSMRYLHAQCATKEHA